MVVVAVAIVVNVTSGGLRHKWQQGLCWGCRPEKIVIQKNISHIGKNKFFFFLEKSSPDMACTEPSTPGGPEP